MRILAEIHRSEGINIAGKIIYRNAVRGVILRGSDLFMVYSSNVGDYKFPGGGVGGGESHQQTLARELLEECGATLLNMDSALGAVIEHDFAEEKDYDIFTMTSYYYLCQIGDGFGQQKLDGYEQELGFMPVWIDIEKAISINRSLLNLEPPPE